MKLYQALLFALISLTSLTTFSQSTFDPAAYEQFLEEHESITAEGLQTLYPLKAKYVKGFAEPVIVDDYVFLDSVILKLEMTNAELDLLDENQFVVTERQSYLSYGDALWSIYKKDLPVMVTTDLILHALHKSYDTILKGLEYSIMEPNLQLFLQGLYNSFPSLKEKYTSNEGIAKSINDIDVYTTVALSLLKNETQKSQSDNQNKVDELLELIKQEDFTNYSLFTETPLLIDFSQFKPRGHYTENDVLTQYFQAMMWLGRIQFYLTPPPNVPVSEEDILRANTNAFLLNELQNISNVADLMDENNTIIDKLVGESDNMTPTEYGQFLINSEIKTVEDLQNNFKSYYEALKNDEAFTSRIASFPYLTDPLSKEPAELPIAYKLSGQRFIIDSYIFTNMVHDRVKLRMMADPLDALICLENNDAINLMQPEIEQHEYAKNLNSMRYLIEHQETDYWQNSFYGGWLNAIKILGEDNEIRSPNLPKFMQTAAWQQQKINTQLAAWTQLRHDNLLYAAQSYTGGILCCFPHSYVEPYPAFYEGIAEFAKQARTFFETTYGNEDSYTVKRIIEYYTSFEEINVQLKTLAEKELAKEAFTDEEVEFLKGMLHESGVCGVTLTGWITELYYNYDTDLLDPDFITADIHTQPTDEAGNLVGKVLHVGNGTIDLGVFLAPSPSNNFEPTAFVGPVSSYYEYINNDFERTNDEEWSMKVINNEVGERPDWVNIYLATDEGDKRTKGRELPGLREGDIPSNITLPKSLEGFQLYPNPATNAVQIITQINKPNDNVMLQIADITGKIVTVYRLDTFANQVNVHKVQLDGIETGIYNFTIIIDGQSATKQVIVQ